MRTPPDRLRHLIELLIDSVADPDAAPVHERAYLSRFHLDRLITAGLGEPPAAFRRRLALERAAWRLQRSGSVTDAGLEAGYEATESFIRAFRRAYGVSPGRFAGRGGDFRLVAANGIHFHPPAGLLLSHPGGTPMTLTTRLLEHDVWLTGELLDHAGRLTDDDLDREVRPGHVVHHFDGPEATARQMLDRLVWTKEVWVAAMEGRPLPGEPDRSLAAMKNRHAAVGPEFLTLARDLESGHGWNDVFVDALCEPPQSFSFGGVFAHILTYSAQRRQLLLDVLAELGLADLPSACPMEWERSRQSDRPHSPEALRGAAAPSAQPVHTPQDAIRRWWQAMQDKDLDRLRELTLPDYLSAGGPDVMAAGRENLLTQAAEFFRSARIDHWALDDVTVRELGGTAVCSYTWEETGEHGGQPFAMRGVATDVLVARDGRWLHQSHHVSMLPPTSP
ncbi:helix-turn-helix domain-containing protein [Rhizohabitans arisaemae]|uniref:helix-turn-helix domain-containing protein n=1 Tax=Rhizohabitans arisaemae TaxID=2720610 RepID=UPI0024B13769|nr:helix-turn-helix domain-containing protein [Rhizohabitans arisaemae]